MSYVLPVMFYLFISPRNHRAPSADRRETLSHDRKLDALYNASPKIWGQWGQNMQNFGRFSTTSDLIANIS